jgi:hypothetical protein
MRESFGQSAQAEVAKSDTIDAYAATIIAQDKVIAELTATTAILVAALAAKAPRTVTSPPGFTAQGAATTNTTGHMVNTAGVTYPTRKPKLGNTEFVVPQDCSVCNKTQYHIPANCLDAPQNTALKAKVKAKCAEDKAVKAARVAVTK